MRIARILALSAAALVGIGAFTAPPASAATSVTIDCATQSSTSFTVSPGEEIVFTLNLTCVGFLDEAPYLISDDDEFAAFLGNIVANNTGATITSHWGGRR